MIWHWDGWGDPLANVPSHVAAVYVLVLNPMRGRTEEQRMVAASDNKTELQAFLDAERVEPYRDTGTSEFGGATVWSKVFREGGPLEWFNPPTFPDRADDWGHGIMELRRDGWRRVA
jgi:hypothetical protein